MRNLTWNGIGPGPDEGQTCVETSTRCGPCGIRKRKGVCPECAEWEEHYREQGRL